MLAEYALTPDIFDGTAYSSSEVCSLHLNYLKDILLEEALVRDLGEGQWSMYVQNWLKENGDRTPQRAKELLKKLIKQRRLRPISSSNDCVPNHAHEWCQVALDSHSQAALTGIITTPQVKEKFAQEPIVAPIDKLTGANWWRDRTVNIRLPKQTAAYLHYLQLVLSHANSLQFIDPYLDPTLPRYREFPQILQAIQRPDDPPLIEIHRVEFDGVGNQRQDLNRQQWQDCFQVLAPTLQATGLRIQVYIWDYFHDRYLISDLVGINLNSGLDLSRIPDEPTTWSRLSRTVRDDIQLEFLPNAGRHTLKYSFAIA